MAESADKIKQTATVAAAQRRWDLHVFACDMLDEYDA